MGFARRAASIGVALALTAVLVVPTAAGEPTVGLAARLDTAVAAQLAELGVPGAIVGLSIPGEIDYLDAVGTQDRNTGAPMSVDEHWRIGSVTKTFTGTAVLQLVDRGLIRLSDPISRYVDGVPSGDVITLDLLGRMRSGLYDYVGDAALLKRLYDDAPDGPDAFAFTSRELLDVAFAHPPNFPPGVQYQYSNTNLVLLGIVVERVTGLSLGDYLARNVFGPVGLTQTSYPANGILPQPFSHGYTRAPDGALLDATLWNPSWADAAGKIVSNYADLKLWAAAVGTGALLSPEAQASRLRTTEIVPGGVSYGFAIMNANGWIGHNGDIPGYTTVVMYLPERDATLVVMTNSDEPQDHAAGQLATAVTQIATPDHVYRLGPAPSASASPSQPGN
jgi:D-alanyl-D-alanine carboxypeptidase